MNIIRSYKRAITLCSILLAATVLYWGFGYGDEYVDWTDRTSVEIIRDENGFHPEMIRVASGTLVRFVNELDRSFWPASDLHPWHFTYPAFDPKRSVETHESWEFVFNREGRWGYHDHLDAVMSGVVIVGTSTSAEYSFRCEGDIGGKNSCWKERIKSALQQNGLARAYEEMQTIYAEDDAFAARCHSFMHDLGLMAFNEYDKHVPLILSTGFCNDGFYHGYMEGFVGEYSDPKEIDWFCDKVARVLDENYPLASSQCKHGIGHGTMEHLLHTMPELWHDLPSLVDMAIEVCGRVDSRDSGRHRCSSGVYSVLGDWLRHKEGYQSLFSRDDPFLLCGMRSEEWERSGCVWEFSKRVVWFTGGDKEKSLLLVEHAVREFDATLTAHAVRSVADGVGQQGVYKTDAHLIFVCRELRDDVESACFQGIVEGLFHAGRPGDEIARQISFCASTELAPSERASCARIIVARADISPLHSHMKEVCSSVSATFPEVSDECKRYE